MKILSSACPFYDFLIQFRLCAQLKIIFFLTGSCSVAKITRSIIDTCNGDYTINDEDNGRYGPGWVSIQIDSGANMSGHFEPWVYRTATDLGSYPYIGQVKTYTGGGFTFEVNSSSIELINDLRRNHWIDERTRAVFVEFSLYNVPTNLFISVSLLSEFMPTNGMVKVEDIKVAKLNRPQDGMYLAVLGCQLVTMVFLVTFIYKEVKKLYRLRRKYFEDPWNWIEIVILVSIGMSVVVLIFRDMETSVAFDNSKPTKNTPGGRFINLSTAATMEELLTYTLGILIFFCNVKLLKLMKFSRRIVIFSKSLSIAAPSLLSFFVVFLVIFAGFSSMYFLTIGSYSKNFRSFIDTLETMLSTLLGGFDYDVMVQQLAIIGPIFFVLFMVFVVMILMNIFLAIIIDSIGEAHKHLTLEDEDVELFAFGMRKLRETFNIRKDVDVASMNNQGFEDENDSSPELKNQRSLSVESENPVDAPCETRVEVPLIQIDCTTVDVGSVGDDLEGDAEKQSVETSLSLQQSQPPTNNLKMMASVPCLKQANRTTAGHSGGNTTHQPSRETSFRLE